MVRMYRCPVCGNPLYKKDNLSGIGQFYNCEHCGYIKSSWDVYNLTPANFADSTLNRCPRCGGAIIQKLGGPRGVFYGCINYPRCDFAYSSSDQNVSSTFTYTMPSSTKAFSNKPKTNKNLTMSQKKQTYQERIDEKIGQTSKINKVQKKQTYPKRVVKAQNINSKPATTTKKLSYDYKPSSSKISSVDKSAGKANGGNNTFKIVILAILCILVIGASFILLCGDADLSERHMSVRGINFNIPANYTQVGLYNVDNLESYDGEWYMNDRGYVDISTENCIFIRVIDVKGHTVNDNYIEEVLYPMHYKKKTINDHDGFLVQKSYDAGDLMAVQNKSVYVFAYEQNGDLILIGATNKSDFYNIIV